MRKDEDNDEAERERDGEFQCSTLVLNIKKK
jgi:hypothetical protein